MSYNYKYFHGEIELKPQEMSVRDFAAHFGADTRGVRSGAGYKWVGFPVGHIPEWIPGKGFSKDKLLPVQRVIAYKKAPSKHTCDARCLNATGRVMRCECACGGKNHGRGAFSCTSA